MGFYSILFYSTLFYSILFYSILSPPQMRYYSFHSDIWRDDGQWDEMTLNSVSPESCLYPRWKTQAACWLTHRAVSQFCTAPSYPPLPSLGSGLPPPGGSALAVMTRFPLGSPATPPLILQYGSWVQASCCFLSLLLF